MKMRRCVFLSAPPARTLLPLLLCVCVRALVACPPLCRCGGGGQREADCSERGLRLLPVGLRLDLTSLNLSHNRLQQLDGALAPYSHLRVLDLSHNRLARLPAGLPRSLWRLHAAANHIRRLEKGDTVHQWNLQALDVSGNALERTSFINNTLSRLRRLDLSHNRLWTLPTNLPVAVETVDLSHNRLAVVLPGSLDRLPVLSHLYLHGNRLTSLPAAAFDQLTALRTVTLGDNPWACHAHTEMSYLLAWARRTAAKVSGCPCEGLTGGPTPHPLHAVTGTGPSSPPPPPSRRTTTLRTRSVWRPHHPVRSGGPGCSSLPLLAALNLLLLLLLHDGN